MKILHISPNCVYNDYWGYQENLLPKYQQRLGHEVSIIVPCKKFNEDKIEKTNECDYVLNDGVHVYRVKYKDYKLRFVNNLLTKQKVLPIIRKLNPDYIFFHGLVSSTIFDAIKYKKKYNKDCYIIEDNHLDYNIGSKSKGIKKFLVRSFFLLRNLLTLKYVDLVVGVTPWRKKYAEEYYKIPTNKTDLLIMGADDDEIDFDNRILIRNKVRKKYNIKENEILLITGGKIDKNKNIIELIDACVDIPVRLLIFGKICEDIREQFFSRLFSYKEKVIFIGWIESKRVYDYFFAGDIAVFPGQHSVLWEQACASGIPCCFKNWEGIDHLDIGGNCIFVKNSDPDCLKDSLIKIIDKRYYDNMLIAAQSNKRNLFLYSNIAKKSIVFYNKSKYDI